MKRVSTGIDRLDKLIEGGLPSNAVVLLAGKAGTGKTLFSLNYLLDGAKKKEKCVYVSLMETKENLIRACKEIKSLEAVENYLGKNLIIEEINLEDHSTVESFANVFLSYPKLHRIVIDNLNKLLVFSRTQQEYRIVLSKLFAFLRDKAESSLVIRETAENKAESGAGETFESDGVIHLGFLELEEKPLRTLEISKLRFTSFEPLVKYNFAISKREINLSTKKLV